MSKIEMIGRKFGMLTVIAESGKDHRGEMMWLCKCECGNITHPITGSVLRNGKSTSCGCYAKRLAIERCSTHRKSQTRLYSIWQGMKARCYRKSHTYYKYYGGRGITICREWQNDFEAFYDWAMDNGYADNLTIDRIDANGNYEPNNCRWATKKEQAMNKRRAILIEINGISKSLLTLSKETGIPYKTLYNRYSKGINGSELLMVNRKEDLR